MTQTTAGAKPILLAFSGGLDTSFCVPWLAETYGRPVVTLTVNTGSIDDATARMLEERSRTLGAVAHHLVDARPAYFEQVIKYLVMGNVRRGNLYPLCVGAERVLQAQTVAQWARKLGTEVVAHGSTAAGNDQVRFEVALRTLAPELEILAPVRDRAFKRPEQLAYLESRKLPVPPFGAAYSVNRGLWGTTIGGKETLTSDGCIGQAMDAVSLIEAVEALGAKFGIGRGIHLGDTIIGFKGRVAFEAPAAEILLNAHRELEKLVLSARQSRLKDSLAGPYGDLVHEGQHLDPVCRDIETFFVSSQQRVTGEVHLLLRPGTVFVEGVASPYSLMKASKGAYGESAGEWTAAEAHGFSKMLALPGIFYTRAGKPAQGA